MKNTELPSAVEVRETCTSGCTFRDRCPRAIPVCAEKIPEFFEVEPGHQVRCWLFAGRERAE